MNFNIDAIRAAIHFNEDGIHQALLDIAYDEWQRHEDWKLEDMIQDASEKYGEVMELALLLGKYNQQVTNGGHKQYLDNGYSGTHKPSYSYDYDYEVPLTRRLENLMLQYGLDKTERGAAVMVCVKEFINRTYAWDQEYYSDPDEYEEEPMPNYDDLDDAYYLVNDLWMKDLERYFKLWMEFNESPVESNRF